LFRNETNNGVIHTKNFLLEKAKGDYIISQDGDDWSEVNRIERLLMEFRADPEISACASNCYRVSGSGNMRLYRTIASDYIPLSNCHNLPFMPSTMMFKAEVFQNIGGLNSFFSGLLAEDYYWTILVAEKYKLKYINTPLYYYQLNENSITNTFDRKEKLVMTDLIEELINQRITTGRDWVEEREYKAIQNFIDVKFSNRKWLGEKFRIMAAVQRDGKKRAFALRLILKALRLNPLNLKSYITLKYILS
jgi:glycosyltransferase involved in cell wall biosynthesis